MRNQQARNVVSRPGLALPRMRIGIGIWMTVGLATLLPPQPVEAGGLFEKLKAKRQARLQSLQRQRSQAQRPAPKPVKKTTASKPKPRYRSYYRDEHKDAYINQELLDFDEKAERKVIVDIGRQRAFLVINDVVAIDTAVSTARKDKHTPRGTFPITEKIRSGKVSTLYHVYMPCWMRLGTSVVGMHVGDLPGYPASAGCIRLPQSVAPILYDHVSRGVTVEVVDSWDEKELSIPYTLDKLPLYASATLP